MSDRQAFPELGEADRALLEGMRFDAAAEPGWNEIAACLVWPDEVPDGLSAVGYELVRDLLVARGLVHRGVPVEDWDYGHLERAERWEAALAAGLRWNGFRRIALTRAQRARLEANLHDGSLQ